MCNKKTLFGIVALVLAAMLTLTTVSASETARWRLYSYPAHIHVEGTITLEDIETDFTDDIEINETFAALVPIYVNPGTYHVGFIGKAVASDDSIKLHGLIIVPTLVVPLVKRGSFYVNFRVDKPDDVPDGIYIAYGELEITISPIQPGEAKVIWVHMKGLVTSYGGKDAFGGIMTHARIAEEEDWAKVHGFLTQQAPVTDTSAEYSFSFLAFRLANATEVALNDDDGNDLYISGLWNVYEVTFTHFDNKWIHTIEQILGEPSGDLIVNLKGYAEPDVAIESETYEPVPISTGGNFTLDIDGLEPIAGNVVFYHIRYGGFFEPLLPIRRVSADHNGDWKVNILDLIKVAKSYGATLGTPRYDFFSDFNFDYSVDIKDLFDIAQTYGQEY
jgi:hypothetical protein